MIDEKLTQLGLKVKNLVLLDMTFPGVGYPKFKSSYDARYVHMPYHDGLAFEYAEGLASAGKRVLICGFDGDLPNLDPNFNVKLLRLSDEANWSEFEKDMLSFGPSLVLIPAHD
jgi:hypothetical protein